MLQALHINLNISIFKSGNSKEWLTWVKTVERADIGQNAIMGPAKYALAKCLLEDRALQAFENVERATSNQTRLNYVTIIKAVTMHIMPKRHYRNKKRYMQMFLKKPLDMEIKDFVEHVIALNELLTHFLILA